MHDIRGTKKGKLEAQRRPPALRLRFFPWLEPPISGRSSARSGGGQRIGQDQRTNETDRKIPLSLKNDDPQMRIVVLGTIGPSPRLLKKLVYRAQRSSAIVVNAAPGIFPLALLATDDGVELLGMLALKTKRADIMADFFERRGRAA